MWHKSLVLNVQLFLILNIGAFEEKSLFREHFISGWPILSNLKNEIAQSYSSSLTKLHLLIDAKCLHALTLSGQELLFLGLN